MVIKVLSIVGARPQLMKAAVLSKIFAKSKRFIEIIVHTGQHYDTDMSSNLMKELFVKTPDYQINSGGKSELAMLANQLVGIEEILKKESPDYVISYGDTTTTLGGALAARKMNIKHVHVEAGVRNYDMSMPEEVNRVLVDKISNLNFCATEKSMQNLLREKTQRYSKFSSTIFSGDLMLDCFVSYSKKISQNSTHLKGPLGKKAGYTYVTLHRQSNVDNKRSLSDIVEAINIINSRTPVVFPLHPRTRNMLKKYDLCFDFETIAPISYKESLEVLKRSNYVITDSGGLVREAFFAKKPSLFILENPVWPEIEEVKCSISTRDISCKSILQQYEKLKNLKCNFDTPIFGNGDAGWKIVRAIEKNYDFDKI